LSSPRSFETLSAVGSLLGVRSLLFAPGNEERKLRNALRAGADAVIADLEDAVLPAAKAEARECVSSVYRDTEAGCLRLVRLNGVETDYFARDLELVEEIEPDAIVLPKASPQAVAALAQGPPAIAIVETPNGLRESYEIASSPVVAALMLGAVDLGLALGLEPREDGQEVLFARSKLVLDSAAAGIRAPFDLVHVQIADDVGLEAECRLARSLGFRGKACIHPRQVAIVNHEFSPSTREIEWARRVLEAYEGGERSGRGAVSLDGEMIDLPVVERARAVLAVLEEGDSYAK
jgi:citrate lyase subunit beta/citryl-CoA lyase